MRFPCLPLICLYALFALVACNETGLTSEPIPRLPPPPADVGGLAPDTEIDNTRAPTLDVARDADDWLPPRACSQRTIERARLDARACPMSHESRPSTFEVREVWRVPLTEPNSNLYGWFIAPPTDEDGVRYPEAAHSTFSSLYSLVDGTSSRDAGLVDLNSIPGIGRALILPDGRLAFGGHLVRLVDRQGASLAEAGFVWDDFDRLGFATVQSHAHARVVDFDGDGTLEFVFGRYIFSFDGIELGKAPFDFRVLAAVTFVDADGDGQLDIATGAGIFNRDGRVLCEVDPRTISGHVGGSASPVVFGDSGTIEVFVQPAYNLSRHIVPGPSRIQDLSCRVRREANLSWEGYDPSTFLVEPIAVFPSLEAGEPSIVAIAADGHPRVTSVNVYDRELRYLRTIFRAERSLPIRGFGVFFDIDGDGMVEWIVLREDPSDRSQHLILAIDLRDGTEHVIAGPAHRPADCYVSDAEGDGHSELYCFEDVDDQRYLVRYEGVDQPWASSFPYYWPGFEPHQHDHTGTVVSGPVDIAELGGFHWMPSTDTWTGRNADLIVQITDVCDEECERGWMTAWVQIGNQGRVGLSRPVVARLYGVRDGEEHLVAETRVPTAPKGWWNAASPLRFPAAGYERLRAEVSGDGWEPEECDLTNNEDVWELSCG